MVPFADATIAAEIGEVTGPVQSDFGFHVLIVDSREMQSFDEIRTDLEASLVDQQAGDLFDTWVFESLGAADIVVTERYGTWQTEPTFGVVSRPDGWPRRHRRARPGRLGRIPTIVLDLLLDPGARVIVRTLEHPAARHLSELREVESGDDLYETADTFDVVYRQLAERVVEAAAVAPVIFAVPGSPYIGERTPARSRKGRSGGGAGRGEGRRILFGPGDLRGRR